MILRLKKAQIPPHLIRFFKPVGHKPKDMINIPAMLAEALREDGWYLRSDMPWVKRSAMPESVTDRPAKALEYVFLLAKKPSYYFDMEAVRKPAVRPGDVQTFGGRKAIENEIPDGDPRSRGGSEQWGRTISSGENGRSFRNADFWFQSIESPHGLVGLEDELVGLDVTTEPFKEAHFATFPTKLVEPCIKAGTSEHGCCPTCGAPWLRVTQKEIRTRKRPNEYVKRTGEVGTGNSCTNTVAGVSVETVGWEPSCDCPVREPVSAIVLDPFCGAGTTILVARRLGRRGIGIELNPQYANMARKRITNDLPLFNTVSIAES